MRETGEWDNLAGFLTGLKNSKRRLKDDLLEKMARWMVESNAQGHLLKLLVEVESTDVGLWNLGVARQAMWGAWKKAAAGGEATQESVVEGLKLAENIWALMWEPKHTDRSTSSLATQQPEIIAVPMLLNAAKAVQQQGDLTTPLQVEAFAKLLFRHWAKLDLKFHEHDLYAINQSTCEWAPVWRGLQLAKEALGKKSPLHESLAAKEDEVGRLLDRAVNYLRQNSTGDGVRRGVVAYETLSKFTA